MMFEREAETMPRAQLAALQLERLRAVVGRLMEKVAFYRDHLGAAGITAESISSLDDLARLPFTCKGDLRDNYPFGLFAVPRPQVMRLHASSGTKGKPSVVGYTAADIDLWARCCARCLVCAGARPGDIVHNAYGYGLFTGGLGLHYGAERLGCTVVPASGGNTPRQAQLLEDLGAEILCCTPSYALAIADHVSEPARLNLRAGLHGAEPWTAGLREAIERALLAIPELAPHYQLVVERPGRLDELTVEAELREGEPGGERLEALVEERLGRVLGLTARVRLGPPGSVARSEGKALRVLDR